MKRIYSFMKNDELIVKKLQTSPEQRHFYASVGIFEGASVQIFFKNKKNIILKIGDMKLALSGKASEEIFAEEISKATS